jgi:lysophospholipase L1-like esterase
VKRWRVLRNLLAHLGLVLMGLVMAVLLAALGTEVTLRVTDAVPEVESPLSGSHQSDAYLGWSGKPNLRLRFRRPEFNALVQHDAEGWRQPEPPRPSAPTSNILVLGDSFTWGWGVSQGQVFTDLLQAALPATVAVYNRGVPGFGTAQEYLVLQRELAARTYDAVVLMFCINDLSDNLSSRQGRRPYFELVDGTLRPRNQPARPVINPVGQFLREHSRAYAYAQFQVELLKRRFSGEANDEREYRTAPAVDFRDVPGYAVTARLLGEMQRLSRQHGARFLLVYIPHGGEIEIDTPFPYVRSIHEMVNDIARRDGIPLLDLSLPFHQHAKAGERLSYAIDGHWSPAGHRVAAAALLASPIFQPLRDAGASARHDTGLAGGRP